jgi:hypothetical protein
MKDFLVVTLVYAITVYPEMAVPKSDCDGHSVLDRGQKVVRPGVISRRIRSCAPYVAQCEVRFTTVLDNFICYTVNDAPRSDVFAWNHWSVTLGMILLAVIQQSSKVVIRNRPSIGHATHGGHRKVSDPEHGMPALVLATSFDAVNVAPYVESDIWTLETCGAGVVATERAHWLCVVWWLCCIVFDAFVERNLVSAPRRQRSLNNSLDRCTQHALVVAADRVEWHFAGPLGGSGLTDFAQDANAGHDGVDDGSCCGSFDVVS